MFFFWMIFITLMLPVEVRIIPTFKVVADLGLLNSYRPDPAADRLGHRHLPLPPVLHDRARRLAEAARIDGAGPMRFFKDVLLPLSRTSIAALFVIQFIYGWNQYLWPLLITTDEAMYTSSSASSA
jgi:sn-glycerol 3-phosphate transport system permease protein